MSISNRVLAGFAAVTLLLALLGAYTLIQVAAVRNTVDRIVERDVGAVVQVDEIGDGEAEMRDVRLAALIRFIDGGVASAEQRGIWDTRAQATAAALGELRSTVARYEENAVNADRAALWRRMATSAADAQRMFDMLRANSVAQFEAFEARDRAAVMARNAAIDRNHADLSVALRAVRGTLDEVLKAGQQAVADTYAVTRWSIIAGLALAIAISIAVAWAIRRSISEPMGEFMGFVGRIGQGDLTVTTLGARKDELGQLGTTLNAMVAGLRQIAAQNRLATENLNAAATEIRASTQEQAASVEEQLAAVQETAATVDEISHSGAQISRRAQEVIAAAQATAETSQNGIIAVSDTARAMDAIREQAEAVATNIVALSEKTQAIGDIIATVNDVSERSHLLALNASIEAAAAGENGRSFAVVASEMKSLADQAKSATRNVRSILGDIQRGINASVMLTEEAVKRVGAGKQRIDASQSAIEELAGRVQESVQTFQQIVASTNQQQIGIEQVTIALQNIRQASQQTAASTRQLDQAAGDLTKLSGTMVSLTERYQG
ncbi:MAG: methyl-accepting chemotaxis protein [Sphingomonas bacterium]|nr:methyl-accepting chemotaxis protein [Sphingomonas bacterium]